MTTSSTPCSGRVAEVVEADAAEAGLAEERDEAACAGALEGSADGGGARAEVEVFPAQAAEYALAESGVEGEFEQRVQPVSARGREELAGFVGGERFEAPGAWGAVAGDVVRALLLAHRVLRGGLEHGRHIGQGQRPEQYFPAAQQTGWSRALSRPWVQRWQVVRSW